jgi:hypothetical protein
MPDILRNSSHVSHAFALPPVQNTARFIDFPSILLHLAKDSVIDPHKIQPIVRVQQPENGDSGSSSRLVSVIFCCHCHDGGCEVAHVGSMQCD